MNDPNFFLVYCLVYLQLLILMKTETNKNMCSWILILKSKIFNSEYGPLRQQYKPGNVSALMQSIAAACTGGTAAILPSKLVQVLPKCEDEHTDGGYFGPGHPKRVQQGLGPDFLLAMEAVAHY